MKRIIAHWTAGGHTPNAVDLKAYHFVVAGDGDVFAGKFPVHANEKIVKGMYAAHTYHSNTGSIGISMAAMRQAKENPLSYGPSPITKVQFEAMCEKIARLCNQYSISVTKKTVLSHAEVQDTLGIKQKNKWDFTVLPHMPKLKGATACGNYMRQRVRYYIKRHDAANTVAPIKTKIVKKEKTNEHNNSNGPSKTRTNFWGWLLRFFRSNQRR